MTAANHDYQGFFQQEIQLRGFMDYPPFSDLILVECTSEDEQLAKRTAEDCRQYLLKCPIENEAEKIFPPKPVTHFKGKDSFRYSILIKCPKGLRNKYIYYIHAFGNGLVKHKIDCNLIIDVNPYSTF
jgi:primosomal protein N' (replication factor Y)